MASAKALPARNLDGCLFDRLLSRNALRRLLCVVAAFGATLGAPHVLAGETDQITGQEVRSAQAICAGDARSPPRWGRRSPAAVKSQALADRGWDRLIGGDANVAFKSFLESLQTHRAAYAQALWGIGVAAHVALPDSDLAFLCLDGAERETTAIGRANAVHRLYSDRCRILEERGRASDAIEYGRRVIATDGAFVEAHICLARSYMATGDETSAMEHVKIVRKLTSK